MEVSYRYESLDHCSSQFRLFTLLPSTDKTSQLHGDLRVVSLSPKQPNIFSMFPLPVFFLFFFVPLATSISPAVTCSSTRLGAAVSDHELRKLGLWTKGVVRPPPEKGMNLVQPARHLSIARCGLLLRKRRGEKISIGLASSSNASRHLPVGKGGSILLQVLAIQVCCELCV
jgi:hypothetical protein